MKLISWLRRGATPQRRVKAAAALLVVSLIAWPVGALTLFRDEPQGVLGLSFLAIILEALILLVTTDVREHQDDA